MIKVLSKFIKVLRVCTYLLFVYNYWFSEGNPVKDAEGRIVMVKIIPTLRTLATRVIEREESREKV